MSDVVGNQEAPVAMFGFTSMSNEFEKTNIAGYNG